MDKWDARFMEMAYMVQLLQGRTQHRLCDREGQTDHDHRLQRCSRGYPDLP